MIKLDQNNTPLFFLYKIEAVDSPYKPLFVKTSWVPQNGPKILDF